MREQLKRWFGGEETLIVQGKLSGNGRVNFVGGVAKGGIEKTIEYGTKQIVHIVVWGEQSGKKYIMPISAVEPGSVCLDELENIPEFPKEILRYEGADFEEKGGHARSSRVRVIVADPNRDAGWRIRKEVTSAGVRLTLIKI